MNSEEHQKLVAVIRGVHEHLRKSLKKYDGNYDAVWKNHLEEDGLRQNYSTAMLELATKKWLSEDCNSRIEWCFQTIMQYFESGGLQHHMIREQKSLQRDRAGKKTEAVSCNEPFIEGDLHKDVNLYEEKEKLKVLDVGSCYNPFAKYENLETFALDLTPATDNVYACDFLQLEVTSGTPLPSKSEPLLLLERLPLESFHVIIFSLVLEYLPATEQRLTFCHKAWLLLKDRGLLLIITPDSKSQHHNAPMIKSWKNALEKLGFHRCVYEKKTHLHCMAYCKSKLKAQIEFDKECSELCKLIYIPQDFKVYAETEEICDRCDEEDKEVCEAFSELPMINV